MLVVSSDESYYQEIAAGFKKSFDKPYDEINLRGLEDESRRVGKNFSTVKPELLVVVGNLAAKMAKESCPDCNIMFAAATNVSGLKLSGANVSGISAQPSAAKIMENLKTVFPDAQRVGAIYQPTFESKDIAALQDAATKAGIKFMAEPVPQMKDIPNVLNKIIPNIDLYLMLDDPGVITNDTLPFIFITCFQKKIPIFTTSQDILKKCGIAGYGYSPQVLGEELASYASDILVSKAAEGKEKPGTAKLWLNKKIAAVYNFNFSAQATSQGAVIQ
jgi:putative ABC transport system substrate-binding protein